MVSKQEIKIALAKIGFSVSNVNQIMNNQGKWLPFFVNLNSIDTSFTGDGWSFVVGYDNLEIREMTDNNGDISAISLVTKGTKQLEQADTFLMFHR